MEACCHVLCTQGSTAQALASLHFATVCVGVQPDFDKKLVGPDGAGYRWEVQDPAFRQFSITAPTSDGLLGDDDMSNSEGSTTTVAELARACFLCPPLRMTMSCARASVKICLSL